MTALPAGYELRVGRAAADIDAAHAFLTQSYWAKGISREQVAAAMAHSLCVTVWVDGAQVGMARVISDTATFAYLADVYVLEPHRRQGLVGAMLARLEALPELARIRRWLLFTQDAQTLYARHGWSPYPYPERVMVRNFPEVYE